MFQTGPNLFLQSFASDTLTTVMLAVSAMGFEPFFAVVLAVLMFGVSFARGFLLLQLLLWSALLNSVLKDLFALPRPVHVDANVLNDGAGNAAPFTSMGATSWFGGLSPDLVERVRAAVPPGFDDYGFPSGHVQSTTVLWGAAAQLWDHRVLARLAPVMILLMALSRLYLGRHFLADVLGGAALGGATLLVFVAVRRARWDARLFGPAGAGRPGLATWAILVAAPLLVALWYPARGGAMLGIGLGFLAVLRRGAPADEGTRAQRAERVGIALVLFAACRGLAVLALGWSGLDAQTPWVAAASRAVPTFVMLWGTVAAARRAGLSRAGAGDTTQASAH